MLTTLARGARPGRQRRSRSRRALLLVVPDRRPAARRGSSRRAGARFAARPTAGGDAISNRVSLRHRLDASRPTTSRRHRLRHVAQPAHPHRHRRSPARGHPRVRGRARPAPRELVATLRHHGTGPWGAPGDDPGRRLPAAARDRRRLLGHHACACTRAAPTPRPRRWCATCPSIPTASCGRGSRSAARARASSCPRSRRTWLPSSARARTSGSDSPNCANGSRRDADALAQVRAALAPGRRRPVGRGRRVRRRGPTPTGPRSRGTRSSRSTTPSSASASERSTDSGRLDRRSARPLRSPAGRGPSGACMHFNLADLWERVADTVPDHDAVVDGERRFTYAELDAARRPARAHAGRGRRRAGRPRRGLPLQLGRVPRDDAGRVQAPRGTDQRQLPLRRGRAALPVHRLRRARGRVPRGVRAEAVRDPRVAAAAANVRRGRRRHPAAAHRDADDAGDDLVARVRGRARGAPEGRAGRERSGDDSTSSTRAARPACPRA